MKNSIFLGTNQFSGKTEVDRFWEKVNRGSADECWEWIATTHHQWGYGSFYAGGKLTTAHRYSWVLHFGEIPNGMCVCHKCDNPPCCNPSHLFLGSVADNNADKKYKGRQDEKGEKNGRAKLTNSDVIKIRYAHKDGSTYASLGRQYKLNPVSISAICTGKNWKHISEGLE